VVKPIRAANLWLRRWWCRYFGHRWRENGGRACPRGEPSCSQPVFQCARCGAYDYGEAGGPGYAACDGCWE
jgi:hypothetical protein